MAYWYAGFKCGEYFKEYGAHLETPKNSLQEVANKLHSYISPTSSNRINMGATKYLIIELEDDSCEAADEWELCTNHGKNDRSAIIGIMELDRSYNGFSIKPLEQYL